jgi:CheY-like chemotaxis protein
LAAVSLLAGCRVFLAEGDPDLREVVTRVLWAEGAEVLVARDRAEGLKALSVAEPDVLLIDLRFPDVGGHGFLGDARTHGCASPAIAVTAFSAFAPVVREATRQFQKVLLKPFELADLLISIASVGAPASAQANVRAALRRCNESTEYRFTSLFRFEGANLSSVWSYDRHDPECDEFPLDATVDGSYCRYVRDTGAPFVIEDSERDVRVVDHPKRDLLRAYCGVPVHFHGRVWGSLCHFDDSPKPSGGAVAVLEREAGEIERLIVELGPSARVV